MPPSIRVRIRELRAAGNTVAEIVTETGQTFQAVSRALGDTAALKVRACELYDAGRSYDEIAEEIGCSRGHAKVLTRGCTRRMTAPSTQEQREEVRRLYLAGATYDEIRAQTGVRNAQYHVRDLPRRKPRKPYAPNNMPMRIDAPPTFPAQAEYRDSLVVAIKRKRPDADLDGKSVGYLEAMIEVLGELDGKEGKPCA
jgi:uncharacterized protein YerC